MSELDKLEIDPEWANYSELKRESNAITFDVSES